jgi:uncharacterized membrane protein YfcA
VVADPLIVVALGFGLGFLIGLTGVGGGLVVAPALYVVLGLSYIDSVAVSLVYSLFTKIVGAIQHARQGTVLWKITLAFGLAGIPGAVLGSWLIYWVGPEAERVLPFFMAGVLALVALLLFVEAATRSAAAHPRPFSPHELSPGGLAAIAGFQTLVGVLLGITSVGSGSLVILSMFYLFRMRAAEIVGSNLVIALIMVIPAALTHYLAAGVNWWLVAVLLVGALVGAALGARATLVLPERTLKLIIVALILFSALATVIRAMRAG